jgi:MFS family permease
MTEKHDSYLAFRYASYRLYIFGWVFALIGTRIQVVAIGWEMYQRTGDALALGIVGLVQAVPTMALALPAGYLADIFNRRSLVMLSLLGMTVTSLGLAVLSYLHGPTTWMYAMLFLDAAALTLGRPARTALLPQILPTRVFANAVTWNMSLQHIASVVGPALGGLVVAIYVPGAYVLSAVGSLLFLLMLFRLEVQPAPRRSEPASWRTVLAGLSFVRRARMILTMISLDLFAVLLGGAVYLLPIFAEDILHVGATGFGWLQAAPAAGAFCMALLLAYLPPIKHAGRTLLFAVAGFGVATIIFGLSTSFWLSLAMLFLTGAFDNISMVIRHTLTQLLTPDQMRGRVSAVSSIFVGASNELGGLESGLMAHLFNPVVSVVSGGIGTILVVVGAALFSPKLRAFGALHEVTALDVEEEAVGQPATSSSQSNA